MVVVGAREDTNSFAMMCKVPLLWSSFPHPTKIKPCSLRIHFQQKMPPPPPANFSNRSKPPVPASMKKNASSTSSTSSVDQPQTTGSNSPSSIQSSTFSEKEVQIMKNAAKAWQTYQRPTFQGIGDEGKSNIQSTITGFQAYEFLLRQEEGKFIMHRWLIDRNHKSKTMAGRYVG